MFRKLRRDIHIILERDPAARNVLEVLACYPGLHAILIYRFSHILYKYNLKFIARLLSTIARTITGIEIHPAAKIGEGLFIDHGIGVVIGETTVIGDNVTIYQGVTLGGTGKDVGKRHPTIGNGVVICAGAKVLGPFHVGDNSKIGAGAVVLKEVPKNCTVVGVPGRIVRKLVLFEKESEVDLNQIKLPDPIQDQILMLQKTVNLIERKILDLEKSDLIDVI